MNPFKLNDQVKTIKGTRIGGIVKYIACRSATQSGGRTCDKKACGHSHQDFVWVIWPDQSLCSYEHTDLNFDRSATEATNDAPKANAESEVAYIEQGKDAINKAISSSSDRRGMTEQNAQIYDGFAQVRQDRSGRAFVYYPNGSPELHQEKIPITPEELDFDAYNNQGITTRKSK